MAQTNDQRPLAACASNLAVALNNATSTVLIEMLVPDVVRRVGIHIKPTVRDLATLLLEAKFHPQGSFITIATSITTTVVPPVTAASGTLATLTAGSNGWFFMDVSGVVAVRFSATCATDGTGLCDAYATANS